MLDNLNNNNSIETNHIKDFSKIHLTWLTPNLRYLFYDSIKSNSYSYFITGLRYEYNIDVENFDLNKAYELYLNGAKNNDVNCLIRLYFIYKEDFLKFKIAPILEEKLYYIFKAFAYSDAFIVFDDMAENHFLSISIINELDDVIELHHINKSYLQLFQENTIKKNQSDELEVKYIISMIIGHIENSYELTSIKSLNELADIGFLEANNKLACFIKIKIFNIDIIFIS